VEAKKVKMDVVKNFPCYLTGAASAGLSLYFLLVGKDHLSLLFASAFLFAICLTDTLFSRIPNFLTIGLVFAGFLCQFLVSALGALGALLGPAAIFQVFLYTALFGGILSVLHVLMRVRTVQAAWGALYAFLASRDRTCLKPFFRLEGLRIPYAAAIAFGYFAYLTWGNIV
jgi:prepilin peptidase CpaA